MRNYFVAVVLAALLASCNADVPYRKAEGAAWATVYHIVYKSDKQLDDSVVATMRQVELALSMFDNASTVSRINRGETDSVDAMTEAVIAVSRRVWKASAGRYDPTIAPLVDLWGFGRRGRDAAIPDSASVAAVLARVGLDKVEVANHRLVRSVEGVELDFSSVAKGFGVDCVAQMLRRNGCNDYMVEIGGEISLSGLNPAGEPWHIALDIPVDSLATLVLTDCAIATSGNYRNFRTVAPDSVVGHTISPLTGYPVATSVISATVVAPTCALADALATALMASDPADARNIVSRFPATRAIIATRDSIMRL